MTEIKHESYFSRREKQLGYKPQHEVVYNSNLPYSVDYLDRESSYALSVIKTNLAKVVLQGELRTGLTYFASQLTRYIRLYGLKFSVEDHVLFTKLLLEAVTIPELECILVERLCNVLIKLLKKRELLSRTDLQLDWVPFYELTERFTYSKMEPMGLEWIPTALDSKLRALIRNSRSYFSPASTTAMLDKWRPLLCPFDVVVSKAAKYFDLFLPTLVYNEAERDVSWKLWLNEFLTLWKSVQNGPSWEKHFVNLFARLAHNNIGYINWDDCVDTLFTRVLRALALPVGKLQPTTGLANQMPIDSACLWIISMIGGSATVKIFKNLKLLLKASETYYHPSNLGKWSTNLLQFLQSITAKFVNRVFRERYKVRKWEPAIPNSHLITDENIEEFVVLLQPVTLLTLYSKLGAAAASKVLQQLAHLRADLVLPSLLDKTYFALGTLTEPHQVRACLSALCSVISPAIRNYPPMRKHVVPLLFQCLPALDPNDFPKSTIAFQFITTCLTLIPLVDCSTAPQYYPNMTEEEKEVCLSTSQLEDFVIQFFDRCIVLLDGMNLGNEMPTQESFLDGDLVASHAEGMSGMIIVTATTMVLQQASEKIFAQCLDKLFQFATNRLLEGQIAMSAATTMCIVAAKANTVVTFEKFIPEFCNRVLEFFADNADAKHFEKIDKQLMWDMKILSEISHVGTKHLLKYKSRLCDVVSKAIEMQAKEGYEAAVRIAKFCVRGWTLFYTHDRKSVGHSIDRDPSSYLALNDWGAPIPAWKINLQWHVPTEEELEAAFDILDAFLLPALQKLSDFVEGKLELNKEELQKILYTVKELIRECGLLLPIDHSQTMSLQEETTTPLKSWPVQTIETLPFYQDVLSKGDRKNLRKKVFETARKALKHIMVAREDDVDAVCLIIDIYSHCFLMHEHLKNEFDQQWKVFAAYKSAMQNPFQVKKKRDRFTHIDRSVLQQRMRILAIERSYYTLMHHNIMLDLLSLSTSHYMKVRGNAQALFFHGLSLVPHVAYKEYLPVVLKNLDKNENPGHQEFKGTLYLLLGQAKSRLFLGFYQKWDALAKVWPAVVNSPHSDKPSIAKLLEKLAVKIQRHFVTIGIKFRLSGGAINAALNLLNSKSLPAVQKFDTHESVAKGEKYLKEYSDYNMNFYNELVNKLLDLYESGNLSWKYSELSLGMISLMLRHDVDIPTRLSALFTSLLVDDSISIRTLAVGCVGSILKQQKRKHVVEMMSVSEITSILDSENDFNPGDRSDNGWLQYCFHNKNDIKEKFNKTRFIDKTHWGYYCWPKQLKTYAAIEKQPVLNRARADLSPGEVPIYDRFTDKTFVEQLVTYLCLENEKGKDKFDDKRVDMFRGLFRNFDITLVPSFKDHVLRLVADKQESNQRCAAEIITGMVMGSKHWDFDKVNEMWGWVLPALHTALLNISVETLKDWDSTFGHIVQNRDPRRIHWVLEFLINEAKQASNSALIEASKLYVLQGGLHQQEWRIPELLETILNHVEPLLGHPFKNIRNRVGSLLASIFLYDVQLMGKPQSSNRTPLVEDFINRVMPQLESISAESSPLPTSASNAAFQSFEKSSQASLLLDDFISVTGADVSDMESLPPQLVEEIHKHLKKMLPPGSPLPKITSMTRVPLPERIPAKLLTKRQHDDELDNGVRTAMEDSLNISVSEAWRQLLICTVLYHSTATVLYTIATPKVYSLHRFFVVPSRKAFDGYFFYFLHFFNRNALCNQGQ